MERSFSHIALFAALIVALGFVPKLTLAFGVPITAQSLGVMLCGTILGAKRGALAVLLFLLLVALGLPVLAGGRGGLAQFLSVTGGFLIGFPIAAYVTGWVMEKSKTEHITLLAAIAAIIGCIGVLYAFGIVGMALYLKTSVIDAALMMGIFVPGDLIKALLCGLITSAIYKARPHAVFSRSA